MVMNTEAAILGRVIRPERDDLAPEAAQFILNLKFPQNDIARMNELAARARDGALSGDEEEEAEEYRRAGDLLALLKSKARLALDAHAVRSGNGTG